MKLRSVVGAFLLLLIAILGIILSAREHRGHDPQDTSEGVVPFVRHDLDLPSDSIVTVAKQLGSYYQLQASPKEGGGGMWVIASSTRVIAKGQDYPECLPIEGGGVPVGLVRYCWTAPSGGYVKDRVTGVEATSTDGSL